MRKAALLFALLLSALGTTEAFAQRFDCPECRARRAFQTCDRPLDNKVALPTRVAAITTNKARCSQVMKLEVDNAASHSLPPVIEIDLGPCLTFDGAVGDIIQVAVNEKRVASERRFSLACRIW
jgi:hypothetical protein